MHLHRRNKKFFLTVLFAVAALAAACGGGSESVNPSSSSATSSGTTSSSTSSGFVFIGDAPPPGSTILQFEITLDTATLCPEVGEAGECLGDPQVALLSEPVEIELEELQLESAFLSLASVPEGTYEGVQLSFSDVELKLLLEDGTVQELESPALPIDPDTVTPTFDPPLEVTPDIDFGFLVDFNVAESIQTDGSGNVTAIAPVVSLVKLPAQAGEEIEELEDVNGRIADLEKSCPTGSFTLIQSNSDVPIENINFDETTEFEGDDDNGDFDCLALANDQLVEVDLRLQAADSSESSEFFAEEIEQDDADEDEEELEGLVFQVNSETQFVLLVREEEGVPNLEAGSFLQVNLMTSTEFEIDDEDEFDIPAELSFAGSDDLLAGQGVEVELAQGSLVIPEGATCATVEDGCAATAEEVELKESTVTAEVLSVEGSDFLLGELPSLFGSAETLRRLSVDCQECFVESILVRTGDTTEFDEPVTGADDLSGGDMVTVRGLLFRSDFGPPEPGEGTPELVAERVRRED